MENRAKERNKERRRLFKLIREEAGKYLIGKNSQDLMMRRQACISLSDIERMQGELIEEKIIAGVKMPFYESCQLPVRYMQAAESLMIAGSYSLLLNDLSVAKECYLQASKLYSKMVNCSNGHGLKEIADAESEEAHLVAMACVYEQRRREIPGCWKRVFG